MKRTTILVLALISAPAFAQDDVETDSPEIIYQDVTEHIFGEVDVFGTDVVPELVMVSERPPMKIGNMITLRTDFNVEMSSSVNEVR